MPNQEDTEPVEFAFPSGDVATFTITERPDRCYYIEVFRADGKLIGVCGFTCPEGMAFQVYKVNIRAIKLEFHPLPDKPAHAA